MAAWGRNTGGGGLFGTIGNLSRVGLAQAEYYYEGDEARAEWIGRDVFDVLEESRDLAAFDLVVLDPPPFARHRADRDRAVRAYRDLNRRALRALAPGGLLLTFSCSPHVMMDAFAHAVSTAAASPSRLEILAQLGADVDHPVLAAHPEGPYLKGLLVRRAAD